MATKSEKERLAVIEEKLEQNNKEHGEIKNLVNVILNKIDDVILNAVTKNDIIKKADKTDLETVKENQQLLNNRLWWLFGIFFVTLLSVLGWALVQLWQMK